MTSRSALVKRLPRPKERYAETYHRPGLKIRADCLPTCAHTQWVVDEAYIRSAGTLEDGREFQDLRLYLRKPLETAPEAED